MNEEILLAVYRWIKKAKNDLLTAKTMLNLETPVTDTTCFHAQQCAEKCFKAYLTLHEQHIEKTHSLPKLVDYCSKFDADFLLLTNSAQSMTGYAVTNRYPDYWREIPIDEAKDAVRMADQVFSFVVQKLGMSES